MQNLRLFVVVIVVVVDDDDDVGDDNVKELGAAGDESDWYPNRSTCRGRGAVWEKKRTVSETSCQSGSQPRDTAAPDTFTKQNAGPKRDEESGLTNWAPDFTESHEIGKSQLAFAPSGLASTNHQKILECDWANFSENVSHFCPRSSADERRNLDVNVSGSPSPEKCHKTRDPSWTGKRRGSLFDKQTGNGYRMYCPTIGSTGFKRNRRKVNMLLTRNRRKKKNNVLYLKPLGNSVLSSLIPNFQRCSERRYILSLDISNNQLTRIKKGDFKDLAALEDLNMAFNEIDVIDSEYLMTILPAGNEKLMAFCDYVLETYVSPTATFTPHIWAEYSISLNRTTNSCESFYSKLKNVATNAHPNIQCFIELLKDIQSENYIQVEEENNVEQDFQKCRFLHYSGICGLYSMLLRIHEDFPSKRIYGKLSTAFTTLQQDCTAIKRYAMYATAWNELLRFLNTGLSEIWKRSDVHEFLHNALSMSGSVFDIALRSPCSPPHYHCEVGDYLNLALPQQQVYVPPLPRDLQDLRIRNEDAAATVTLDMLSRVRDYLEPSNRQTLNITYITFIKPILLCNAEVLITANNFNLNRLEVCHNQALRLITGAAKSTPITAMQALTQNPPIYLTLEEQALTHHEKMLRLTTTKWEKRLLQSTKLKKQTSFLSKVTEIKTELNLPKSKENILSRENPLTFEPINIQLDLEEPVTKSETSKPVLKALSLEAVNNRYPPEEWLHIYTDGSTVDNN
ncbi:hypothetical protein ANN_15214 [Periplaneta americana]|uniref:Uncharacterized protein n=1 Tax=Periplaneta americana TaxID=6978 RepID=A0ABQ8SFR4_PERAM|nr:hypothetical protein ANN_15214 [Periplaneta americana]